MPQSHHARGRRIASPARPVRRRHLARALWLAAPFFGLLAQASMGQGLPPVIAPPQNPITESKRVLGKILFWDEQLSFDNTVACGTCHRPQDATSDPRLGIHPGPNELRGDLDDKIGSPGVRRADADGFFVSDPIFGTRVQVTTRSAQPVFMSMFSQTQFWDGRAGDEFVDPQTGLVSIPAGGSLETQALAPIVSDVEMGHEDRDWDAVTAKLVDDVPLALAANLPPDVAAALVGSPSYPELFDDAFGDDAITAERIAFAIATYERTLVPDQTPWDAFIAGNPNAMTPGQTAGWNFFQGSVCSICHTPPRFTNNSFRNIGLRPIAEDQGRREVTKLFADRGRFKVPSLRNVGLKPTFMHNGGVVQAPLNNMNDVLNFYIEVGGHVQFPDNKDPLINAIILPPGVRPGLVDFLTNALTDPRVAAGTFPFDRPTLRSERVGPPGDCDIDGDQTVIDYGFLQPCMTGPAGGLFPPGCVCGDMDVDGDIDLADYADMQQAFALP